MALHRFLGMDIGVPAPAELAGFFASIGLEGGGDRWGTADLPDQIRIQETRYRQLQAIHLACDDEADLAAIASRLERLGVASRIRAGELRCTQPGHGWEVTVRALARADVAPRMARTHNAPGVRARKNLRAEVVLEKEPRPPRRLGHVVVGSPDPTTTVKFFTDGLGFRTSDIVGGIATFLRCSSDHHNLLVLPGPVPYLNHYAFELDDIDDVGAAAARYLAGQDEDRHVVGLGRHVVGSNVFWYMKDPCGTMFEFFSDMDSIPDDDVWQIGREFAPTDFAKWGPQKPPGEFFIPADIGEIARLRQSEAA